MNIYPGPSKDEVRVVFQKGDATAEQTLNSSQLTALLNAQYISIDAFKDTGIIEKTAWISNTNGVSLQVFLR